MQNIIHPRIQKDYETVHYLEPDERQHLKKTVS